MDCGLLGVLEEKNLTSLQKRYWINKKTKIIFSVL